MCQSLQIGQPIIGAQRQRTSSPLLATATRLGHRLSACRGQAKRFGSPLCTAERLSTKVVGMHSVTLILLHNINTRVQTSLLAYDILHDITDVLKAGQITQFSMSPWALPGPRFRLAVAYIHRASNG